jgi:hypothetical protein
MATTALLRGRFGTGAVILWGFGVNVALQKGWLDSIPNWGVAAMLVIPLIVWVWMGLTHDRFRRFLNRTNRNVALTVFISVGALIGGGFGFATYALLMRSQSGPRLQFSVAVKGVLLTPSRAQAPLFWMIHDHAGERRISPVHFTLFVQFTNLESRNMMIDSYGVFRVIDGKLIPLPSIPPRGGTFVNVDMGNNFTKCLKLDFSGETFDDLIRNKHIVPNETVQGWIFLEALDREAWGPLRLKVTDTVGAEGIEDIRSMSANDRTSLRAQDGSIGVVGGGSFDCSDIKRAFYSDGKLITPPSSTPDKAASPP